MSSPAPTQRWMPHYGWWVMLAMVIAIGMLGNWALASFALVVLLVHTFRPFDFMASIMLVTTAATFVYYEGGRLTFELSVVSGTIVLMLVCYALFKRKLEIDLPVTKLTWAIVAYVLLSTLNFARGVLSGYGMKYLLLDFLPVLGVGTSLLIADGFDRKRDPNLILPALIFIGFGSASLGFYIFSVIHTRTSGVYFNATPGLVALLLVNLALRADSSRRALLWLAISLPLFVHQFLSFRRALWMSGMAALVTTVAIFAIGRGRGPRWRRVGLVLGTLLIVGAVGAASLQVLYGQGDILEQAAARFGTIGSTDQSIETRANVARLIESTAAFGLIQKSPWIGHGLGYTFLLLQMKTGQGGTEQWWLDENYLMIWLKQGLIGLLLYLWLLVAAFQTCLKPARTRQDPWEATWLATTAAATVYLAIFSITDFPFSQTNPVFLYALLFGVSMALTRSGALRIVWSNTTSPGALPTPRGETIGT